MELNQHRREMAETQAKEQNLERKTEKIFQNDEYDIDSEMTKNIRIAAAALSPQDAAREVQADLKQYKSLAPLSNVFHKDMMFIKGEASQHYRAELAKKNPALLMSAIEQAFSQLEFLPIKIQSIKSGTQSAVQSMVAGDITAYEYAKKEGIIGNLRATLDNIKLHAEVSQCYRKQLVKAAPRELLDQVDRALVAEANRLEMKLGDPAKTSLPETTRSTNMEHPEEKLYIAGNPTQTRSDALKKSDNAQPQQVNLERSRQNEKKPLKIQKDHRPLSLGRF